MYTHTHTFGYDGTRIFFHFNDTVSTAQIFNGIVFEMNVTKGRHTANRIAVFG